MNGELEKNSADNIENIYKSKITVGIPVFNEEKTIEKVLNSAVSQADTIIISDNASTDSTEDICRKFSQKHKNVTYIRHNESINILQNFYVPLSLAETKYFMWLGGHDMIAENYVLTLISAMEKNPSAALAFSAVDHMDEYLEKVKFTFKYKDDFCAKLASKDPLIRTSAIIKDLGKATMMYGIYRTKKIKKIWILKTFLGYDRAFLSKLASVGEFISVPEAKLKIRDYREETTDEMNERHYKAYLNNPNAKPPKKIMTRYKDMVYEQIKAIMLIPKISIIRKIYHAFICYKIRIDKLKALEKKPMLIENFLKMKKFQKRIDKLAKHYKNKKIIIYGAGKAFEAINKNFNLDNLNIIGIADMKFDDGQEYLGYETFSPKTFLKEPPDVVLISMLQHHKAEKFFKEELIPEFGEFKYEPFINDKIENDKKYKIVTN